MSHAAHLAFAPLALLWELMMIAMMAPTAARWIAVFATLGADRSRPLSRVTASAGFAAGYVAAWIPYSAAAAALQLLLQRAGRLSFEGALAEPAAGLLLVGAGLFQFAPIKRACLEHCRHPLTFFLARWRNGPPAPVPVGFRHGIYCVGCCWALMATVFAAGVADAAWMTALAVLAAVEQMTRHGRRIGAAAGVAMVAWGVRLAIAS